MKQEEIFKALIKELFEMDTTHYEYQDNDAHYVVDSTKDGNTLNFTVQVLENKDKEEFENWLKQVDDNLLAEVLDELSEKEGLLDLDQLYQTKDYKKVINKVKSKTIEIADRKIKELKKLLA